jgi:ATP-dependent DNA ligase
MASTFWAWDGEHLMSMPLHERRSRLATVLEEAGEGGWFSGPVESEQGLKLFGHARALNLEGILSKLTESRYRSERHGIGGRSRTRNTRGG